MAGNPDLTRYKDYIESGCWKCPNSPTGAHHWVLHDIFWVCKYCGDVRRWPMTFEGAVIRSESGIPYYSLEKEEPLPYEWQKVPMRRSRVKKR